MVIVSFDILFMIRPCGVVSKNDIAVCMTDLSMRLCSCFDMLTQKLISDAYDVKPNAITMKVSPK